MSENTTITRIRAISFMRSLDTDLQDKVITLFAGAGRAILVQAGTTVCSEGDEATQEGLLLLTGSVLIQRKGAPEVIASAPDLIGEMGQFNPQKTRTATVSAHTELRVIQFNWEKFHEAAKKDLKPKEYGKVTQVLQEHAWEHFTG